MGQMMSSTGETSRARNLVSVRQRKKKQFLRGAARSITNRQDAHAAKQMAAACAVVGNSRNRSRSFIEAPVRKLNSADQIEHGRFEVRSWAAVGRRELQPGRESPRTGYFFLLYSTCPKNPGARIVSVRLT